MERKILASWVCVKTGSLRTIMGYEGDLIHTENNDCDCPSCMAKMDQISREQIS